MCSIAIAEDRKDIRELLAEICRDSGHVVIAQMKDFLELKSFAGKGISIDCLLLDTTLPHVRFNKAVEFIRRKMPGAFILLLGNGVGELRKSPSLTVIPKPLLPSRIIEALRSVSSRDPLETHY